MQFEKKMCFVFLAMKEYTAQSQAKRKVKESEANQIREDMAQYAQ